MHTRQGVAVPALSENNATPSARPNLSPRSRFEAIDALTRLHREALDICAAARISGRYTPQQCIRMREIHRANEDARQSLSFVLPRLDLEPLRLDPVHGMYPPEVNLDGSTRHSRQCKALFNRRDWSCHRCCELMKGSAPRKGWQKAFFGRKLDSIGQRRFLW